MCHEKLTVCVLFGGDSPEHEVSSRSGAMVLENIDRDRFRVVPVGIRRDGTWLRTADDVELVRSGAWETDPASVPAILSPARNAGGAGLFCGGEWIRVDCVFPILHGENGEDGSVQGVCKLAGIPCVGCGVASSAVCMDKIYTKMVCDYEGIPQADCVISSDPRESVELVAKRVETKFDFPVFVKPANTGSSVGVAKAKDHDALIAAINDARRYDSRVLIEEFIDGMELETAVLGNFAETVSGVGQIIPAQEFYSYDAKYNDDNSAVNFEPDLPKEKLDEIREIAGRVFRVLGCKGFSRVDFFCRYKDQKVIFNEINTLPGFTVISMYPKLIARAGIDNTAMISRLIELALENAKGRVTNG